MNYPSVRLMGIVMDLSEKISKASQQKYCFVHISDPGGDYEITLFGDRLTTWRAFLTPGSAVCITGNISVSENVWRLWVKNIIPLQAFEHPEVWTFTIEKEAHIERLKFALQGVNRGKSILYAHIASGELGIQGRVLLGAPFSLWAL